MDGDEIPSMGVSELRIGDGAADVKGKDARGVGLQTIPQKEPAPAPPVPAKRIGLGRQFGRLGGAVAGKGRRNQ
jgi:vacuole morphology and inheritance protein 14